LWRWTYNLFVFANMNHLFLFCEGYTNESHTVCYELWVLGKYECKWQGVGKQCPVQEKHHHIMRSLYLYKNCVPHLGFSLHKILPISLLSLLFHTVLHLSMLPQRKEATPHFLLWYLQWHKFSHRVINISGILQLPGSTVGKYFWFNVPHLHPKLPNTLWHWWFFISFIHYMCVCGKQYCLMFLSYRMCHSDVIIHYVLPLWHIIHNLSLQHLNQFSHRLHQW
jgi:hypothetical protein